MSCRKKKKSLSGYPGSRRKCDHKKKRNQFNLRRQNCTQATATQKDCRVYQSFYGNLWKVSVTAGSKMGF